MQLAVNMASNTSRIGSTLRIAQILTLQLVLLLFCRPLSREATGLSQGFAQNELDLRIETAQSNDPQSL
jgi:cobyrinic acid a,c-diamide synthase